MSRTTSVLKTIAMILAIPVVIYLMLITTSPSHNSTAPPVGCNIGRVIDYKDPSTKQEPICKDEVENTTPTPVTKQ